MLVVLVVVPTNKVWDDIYEMQYRIDEIVFSDTGSTIKFLDLLSPSFGGNSLPYIYFNDRIQILPLVHTL